MDQNDLDELRRLQQSLDTHVTDTSSGSFSSSSAPSAAASENIEPSQVRGSIAMLRSKGYSVDGLPSGTPGVCPCGYRHCVGDQEFDFAVPLPGKVEKQLHCGYNEGDDYFAVATEFFALHGHRLLVEPNESMIGALAELMQKNATAAREAYERKQRAESMLAAVQQQQRQQRDEANSAVAIVSHEERVAGANEVREQQMREQRDAAHEKQRILEQAQRDRAEREAERKYRAGMTGGGKISTSSGGGGGIRTLKDVGGGGGATAAMDALRRGVARQHASELAKFEADLNARVEKMRAQAAAGEDEKRPRRRRRKLVGRKSSEMVAPLNGSDDDDDDDDEFHAFSGEGHRLADTGSWIEQVAAGEPEPAQAREFVLDESQPTAKVRVTLPSGKRTVVTVNLTHTVADLRACIETLEPATTTATVELVCAFPRRTLADAEETIEAAGLSNASVLARRPN